MILDFFKKKCTHKNVAKSVKQAYCPDCGELILNSWYIARCSTCGIKRHAHTAGTNIVADTKFCPNCGGCHIEAEKIEKLSFIDVEFAIHVQEIVEDVRMAQSIVWEDKNRVAPLKLIGTL